MTEYIKYSVRNGITDPFIANLVDYIERVIGWDIETVNTTDKYTSINSGEKHIYLYENTASLTIDGHTKMELSQDIFRNEYTNLLSHFKK